MGLGMHDITGYPSNQWKWVFLNSEIDMYINICLEKNNELFLRERGREHPL